MPGEVRRKERTTGESLPHLSLCEAAQLLPVSADVDLHLGQTISLGRRFPQAHTHVIHTYDVFAQAIGGFADDHDFARSI